MYCGIYEFEVDPEMESEFESSWHALTKVIHEKYGSLGARLHRIEAGKYFAYAQWPSKERWDSAFPNIDLSPYPENETYQKARLSTKVVYVGKATNDFLNGTEII